MRETEAEQSRSPWWDGALRCSFPFLSFSPSNKLPCYPYPSRPLGEVTSNDITWSHNAPWDLHVRKLSVVYNQICPPRKWNRGSAAPHSSGIWPPGPMFLSIIRTTDLAVILGSWHIQGAFTHTLSCAAGPPSTTTMISFHLYTTAIDEWRDDLNDRPSY